MREFIRFMLGRYWNDPDSNAAGGRETLLFCWVVAVLSIIYPVGVLIAFLVG